MIMIIINIVRLQQNQSRIEVVRWNSREGETKEVFAEIIAQSMYQLVSISCLMTCLFLVRILNHMECSWRGPSRAVGKGDAAPALSWFPPAVRTTKPYSILSTYPPSPPYPPPSTHPVAEYCGCRKYRSPSAENPELSDILWLKPGVYQNVALYTLPTARKSFYFFLPLHFIQLHFPPSPLQV